MATTGKKDQKLVSMIDIAAAKMGRSKAQKTRNKILAGTADNAYKRSRLKNHSVDHGNYGTFGVSKNSAHDPLLANSVHTANTTIQGNSFLDQTCEILTNQNIKHAQKEIKEGFHNNFDNRDPVKIMEMVQNGMYNQFNISRPKYGIKGYHMPGPHLKDHNYFSQKLPADTTSREKYHFITQAIKQKEWIPDAQEIPGMHPWGEDKYYRNSAEENKYLMSKLKKTTMTARVQRQAREEGVPGPKYDLKNQSDFYHNEIYKHHESAEKFCGFIDEAEWQGHQSPPHKYNPKYKLQDNTRTAKIHKESKWENENLNRLKPLKIKKKEVAPGDYEVCDSFRHTQFGNFKQEVGVTTMFSKAPLKTFIDKEIKTHKFVPGVGHYKYDEDKAQSFMKGSPRPDAMKRH